jgi:hypothetical protein
VGPIVKQTADESISCLCQKQITWIRKPFNIELDRKIEVVMWIEKHRNTFYSNSSLFFSVIGWLICIGGFLWASFMVVNVEGTVIPNDTFVALFFTLCGAAVATLGFVLAVIAYALKIRNKRIVCSLVLSGLLMLPIGAAFLMQISKTFLH